jgi:ketopantoate reductase
MNERIRELMIKADYPAPELALRAQALAESIVQECISIVQKRYMGDNNREDMEVLRCVADMKKHFGVEE